MTQIERTGHLGWLNVLTRIIRTGCRRHTCGFSLIELIMVIMLMGILVVIISPFIFKGTSAITVSAMALKIRDDIRYAQTLAMQRHKLDTPSTVANPSFRYRMTFGASPVNIYTIVNDANNNGVWGEGPTENVRDPYTGDTSFSVELNSGSYAGIEITGVGFNGNILEFDIMGIPYDGAGRLSASKSITITKDGETKTITVSSYTGAVTIQ